MSSTEREDDERIADWFHDLVSVSGTDNTSGTEESTLLNTGLITYGSLLHPDEIRTLFPHEDLLIEPVKVTGYARRFSKSVAEHLRDVEGDKSGVLNVHAESEEWFNGLLVGPVTRSGLRKYAFREREYDITSVSFERIDFYGDDESILERLDVVHTCLLDTHEGDPPAHEPIPDYLDLCLEGTKAWGEDFREDFLETTLVKGLKLREYIRYY